MSRKTSEAEYAEGMGAFRMIVLAFFCILFCVLLLILKVTSHDAIPWPWVFSPLWGSGIVINAFYIGKLFHTCRFKEKENGDESSDQSS